MNELEKKHQERAALVLEEFLNADNPSDTHSTDFDVWVEIDRWTKIEREETRPSEIKLAREELKRLLALA